MEIGRVRKAGRQTQVQLNALIRREVTVLMGSGGWRRRKSSGPGTLQRAEALRQPEAGANRVLAAELKVERAVEPVSWEAK